MPAAIFLDRDGTLIEDREYLSNPDEVAIFPKTAEALKRLENAGYKLFIVSNQSGVGRGYFSMTEVDAVNKRVLSELATEGVHFEKIYIAPEAPGEPSRGRKPSPQFLYDARDEFGIELASSFMIGDKLLDLQCGWNAGVKRSLLVRTGYGDEVVRSCPEQLGSAVVVDNLDAAAEWIISQGSV